MRIGRGSVGGPPPPLARNRRRPRIVARRGLASRHRDRAVAGRISKRDQRVEARVARGDGTAGEPTRSWALAAMLLGAGWGTGGRRKRTGERVRQHDPADMTLISG